jgi:hypothetical protein
MTTGYTTQPMPENAPKISMQPMTLKAEAAYTHRDDRRVVDVSHAVGRDEP